jgi:hypothetical protein
MCQCANVLICPDKYWDCDALSLSALSLPKYVNVLIKDGFDY